jgi:hypothetical protein
MSTKAVVAASVAIVVAGLPSTSAGSPGAGSLTTGDGSATFMVAPAGGTTMVTKIRGSDRTAQVTRRLPGSFTVPVVAGIKEGLTGNGRTLVLESHPAAYQAKFVLLDTRTLRVVRTMSLAGIYSFDAISPDGSKLYVLRFLSRDATHYAVQALDTRSSRPVARTVVEKGEPGEAMSGRALTRTSSPDGSWVYTLYDGAGETPFVHALSTVDTYTVCIDLDSLEGRGDLSVLDLALNPRTNILAVKRAGAVVATINTDGFEVTAVRAAPASHVAAANNAPRDIPWLIVGLVAVGVVATTTLLLSGARRARA